VNNILLRPGDLVKFLWHPGLDALGVGVVLDRDFFDHYYTLWSGTGEARWIHINDMEYIGENQ